MSAFNRATDLPPAINTVEEVLAWAALSLHNLFKGTKYKEAEAGQLDPGTAPLIDVSIIQAADGTFRLLIRGAVELAPEYITESGKLWTFAREFGAVALPNAYKVD